MSEEAVTYCPLCGNKVSAGLTKCPVCATALRPAGARAPGTVAPLSVQFEDFLHRELPKIELPPVKQTCPLCARELTGSESKCPRCGIPLSTTQPAREEMLECPECGAVAPVSAVACPKCGVGFVQRPGELRLPMSGEKPAPAPEPQPPSLPPERPLAEVKGLKELAPAAPQAPPALVSDRGAINGTGFVNGTGLINGTRGEPRPLPSQRRAFALTRWQFLAVLIAIVVVIPAFIFLSYTSDENAFVVDGDFEDWEKVEKLSMYVQASSPSAGIESWAFSVDGTRLFIYFSTLGAAMAGPYVCSYYVFIDSDNRASTGYAVRGLGADYLMQLDGWNGSVKAASLSSYLASATDCIDWNSWREIGGVRAVAVGSQVEAMADLPVILSEDSELLLVSKDAFGQSSVSYEIPVSKSLLVVELFKGADVSAEGLIQPEKSVAIMSIRLSCIGADGTVNAIYPTLEGVTLISPIQHVPLVQGHQTTVDVLVDASSLLPGTFVSAAIHKAGIDSTFSEVDIIGQSVNAYVGSPPPTIVIDGAFADWTGLTATDSDSVLVGNPDIDIDEVGAVNGTANSYFYVSVHGTICAGTYLPVAKLPTSGGGGGVVIPTRKTGEDMLRIFVDSDLDHATGEVKSLGSKIIGADYMIEIRGLQGNITSRSLMVYAGGQWSYDSADILAANDEQRIEVGIDAVSLGGSSSIDFIIETTDWTQRVDYATAVPQGTRALPVGLLGGADLDSWIIDASSTSSAATAMSYQRKLFYDGINFWSFFWDGANTRYKWSADGGKTWSTSAGAFSSAGVNKASVWYDAGTQSVYIVGDTDVASTNVKVRKGTVDPVAHTITWTSNDINLRTSTLSLGGKNTYITRDLSGYIWVVSSNLTSSPPPRYALSVFRSQGTDAINSWLFMGTLASDQPDSNLKGSIVNVGTANDMLAVYIHAGSVFSRLYTGTWSAEYTIYDNKGSPENTVNAPPSVAVDARGTAHVVYGDGHREPAISKPYIYYVYYNANGWSAPLRLDTVSDTLGNVYPTVSVDLSTGNVWAFWLETDVNGVAHILRAKKNVSGTWSFFTINGDTTNVKQYLTSVFSAPNEQFIAFQWTQNTTTPIHVMFDRIPEFGDIAVPVFSLVAVFLAVRLKVRRGRDGG